MALARRTPAKSELCLSDPNPQGLALACPILWAYLSDTQYDDGTSRKPSTLTVFIENLAVKLCLNDRAEDVTAWMSGRTLEVALERLEEALRENSVEWRGWKKKK